MKKPKVGVISAHSELLDQDYVQDLLCDEHNIDLDYEDFIQELEEEGKTEEEINEVSWEYTSDESTYLIGDGWILKDGKYEIDKTKEFAATFSSHSNNICVEYSKYTRMVHHTSPCYMMADGSGPCGDLDTEGDSVLAYDLPKEYYSNNK